MNHLHSNDILAVSSVETFCDSGPERRPGLSRTLTSLMCLLLPVEFFAAPAARGFFCTLVGSLMCFLCSVLPPPPLCRWLVLFIVQVQVLAGCWLMDNLGSALAAAMKKWWHVTAIIHPGFVPAALRSVCSGMERRAEGWRDGGMNGAGCGCWWGVDWATERWRSQGGVKRETPMRKR